MTTRHCLQVRRHANARKLRGIHAKMGWHIAGQRLHDSVDEATTCLHRTAYGHALMSSWRVWEPKNPLLHLLAGPACGAVQGL